LNVKCVRDKYTDGDSSRDLETGKKEVKRGVRSFIGRKENRTVALRTKRRDAEGG